jgi:hypothetical protein
MHVGRGGKGREGKEGKGGKQRGGGLEIDFFDDVLNECRLNEFNFMRFIVILHISNIHNASVTLIHAIELY